MPDDHSELVPLLPISNRKVKRLSADDSAGSRVKVGHCQALMPKAPNQKWLGAFLCLIDIEKGLGCNLMATANAKPSFGSYELHLSIH